MPLKNNFSYLTPFGRLVFLGGLMIFGTIIAMAIFYTINTLIWEYNMNQLSYLSMVTDPNIIWVAKYLQIFSQIGLFILPAIAFAFLVSNSPWKELGISKALSGKGILFVLIITLLAIPFINLLAIWNAQWHLPQFLGFVEDWMREMQHKNDILLQVMLQMNSNADILINILMVVLLPAIGEELIFRGVIQKQLHKWVQRPHTAIIVTALLFSAFHMQFLGFLSRFLLGMLFGYFYYYSKNLWSAIWAHLVNNGLALILAIIYGTQNQNEVMDGASTVAITIPSILLFGLSIFLLLKTRNKLT